LKKITILDIARELNITFSTVARALNDHPAISTNTKALVRETAERLGYTRNKIASSLRSGKTKVIGLIVPRLELSFFSSVIHGIEHVINANGYTLLLYQSRESVKREIKGIETFLQLQVDGIIASISLETTSYKHFTDLRKQKVPLLLFDRIIENADIPYVSINDYKGGFMATEHLIKQGYKNIVIISTNHKISIFQERLKGSIDALKFYNLPVREDLIFYGNPSKEFGESCIRQLYQNGEVFDGIVTPEDYTALGAIQALKSYGLKVPEDVGVIGFANEAFGDYITPRLTTIDQQNIAMGEQAASLLVKLMKSSDFYAEPIPKIIIDPILIPRESSVKKD